MKIKYALNSCNDDGYYLDFWNVVYPVWVKKLGITPVLIHIGDIQVPQKEDNLVFNIKAIPDIPIALQSQWARFYFTSSFPDDICVISDIDMLPLSPFYFNGQIENIPDDKYVHLNPCPGDHIPACYHVAKGRTFKKVLEFKDTWEEDIRKMFTESYPQNGWFADEWYSHGKIVNYPDQTIFKFLQREGGTNGHRIDRIAWHWQVDLLQQDYYYDSHLLRSYGDNKEEIDRLIKNIRYDTTRLKDLDIRGGTYQETKSDIVEHLDTLSNYAKNNVVVEFGVRVGVSTVALLDGNPKKLTSYDLDMCPNLDIIKNVNGRDNFEFRIGNTLEIEIEECDVLFIDTLHTYAQLRKELLLHASKVRQNILFHDTTSYGYSDEWANGEGIGLVKAIEEFILENKEWKIKEIYFNNNGLTVLERTI